MGFAKRLGSLVPLFALAAGVLAGGESTYAPPPGGNAPPPLFDPRAEPITEAAMVQPAERAQVVPKLEALRANRHRFLLGDRRSEASRQAVYDEAYMVIETLDAISPDGELVMRAIGEVEATAGTLLTLGDRERAKTLLSIVQFKVGQLLSGKPLNPVLRFMDRSVTLKVALLNSGLGGPMPAAGGAPPPPPPVR